MEGQLWVAAGVAVAAAAGAASGVEVDVAAG